MSLPVSALPPLQLRRGRLVLLTLCVLALIFFFGAIFYALRRKRYVRATFKGPLASFFVEFEADDGDDDPKH